MSTTQLSSRHSKGPQVNVGPAHSQRLGRVYAPLRATTGLPRAPSLTARASSGNGGPAADDDDETHIESRALQEILAGWVHGGTVASIAPLSAADSKGPAELQQLFIRRQEQLSSEAGSSTEAGAHHRAVQTHMKLFAKLMAQYHDVRVNQRQRASSSEPDSASLLLPDALHLLLLGVPDTDRVAGAETDTLDTAVNPTPSDNESESDTEAGTLTQAGHEQHSTERSGSAGPSGTAGRVGSGAEAHKEADRDLAEKLADRQRAVQQAQQQTQQGDADMSLSKRRAAQMYLYARQLLDTYTAGTAGQQGGGGGVAADAAPAAAAGAPDKALAVFHPLLRKACEVFETMSAAHEGQPGVGLRRAWARGGSRRLTPQLASGTPAWDSAHSAWSRRSWSSGQQQGGSSGSGAALSDRDLAMLPSLLHQSTYRLLRMAHHSPLRYDITLSTCDPSMAVVGWAVTMAGAAAAQQLARFDPYDSDSCQVVFMSCVSSHSQAAAEWPVVCRKPLLTVDCGKERAVGLFKDIAKGAQSLAWCEAESEIGNDWGRALRVYALSQQVCILQQRRTASLSTAPHRATPASLRPIQRVATQLADALHTLTGIAPPQPHSQRQAAEPAGAAAAAQPSRPPRHCMVAADAWQRLGCVHAAAGESEAAVRCFTLALEAYELFERAACDNLEEFERGRDHEVFVSMVMDRASVSAPVIEGSTGSAAVPGLVWLHRERIRCAFALLDAHLAHQRTLAAQPHPAPSPSTTTTVHTDGAVGSRRVSRSPWAEPTQSPSPPQPPQPPPPRRRTQGHSPAATPANTPSPSPTPTGPDSTMPAGFQAQGPALSLLAGVDSLLGMDRPTRLTALIEAYSQHRQSLDLAVLEDQQERAKSPASDSGQSAGSIQGSASAADGAGASAAGGNGGGDGVGASSGQRAGSLQGEQGMVGSELHSAAARVLGHGNGTSVHGDDEAHSVAQRAVLAVLQSSYQIEQRLKHAAEDTRGAPPALGRRGRRVPRAARPAVPTAADTASHSAATATSTPAEQASAQQSRSDGGSAPAAAAAAASQPAATAAAGTSSSAALTQQLLTVDDVCVLEAPLAQLYTVWYRQLQDIVVTHWRKRFTGRYSALARALSLLSHEARDWDTQRRAIQEAYHSTTTTPTTHTGDTHPDGSQSQAAGADSQRVPVGAPSVFSAGVLPQRDSGGGVSGDSGNSTGQVSGPCQSVERQCEALLQLWRDRPAGVRLDARQQVWLTLAGAVCPAASSRPPLRPSQRPTATPAAAAGSSYYPSVLWSQSADEDTGLDSNGRGSKEDAGEGDGSSGVGEADAAAPALAVQEATRDPAVAADSPADTPAAAAASSRGAAEGSGTAQDAATAAAAAAAAAASTAGSQPADTAVLTSQLRVGRASLAGVPLRLEALVDTIAQLATPALPTSPFSGVAALLLTASYGAPSQAREIAAVIRVKGNIDGLMALSQHSSTATSSPNTAAPSSKEDAATSAQGPVPSPTSRLSAHLSQQRVMVGVATLLAQRRLLSFAMASKTPRVVMRQALSLALPVDLKLSAIAWLVEQRTKLMLHTAIAGVTDLNTRYQSTITTSSTEPPVEQRDNTTAGTPGGVSAQPTGAAEQRAMQTEPSGGVGMAGGSWSVTGSMSDREGSPGVIFSNSGMGVNIMRATSPGGSSLDRSPSSSSVATRRDANAALARPTAAQLAQATALVVRGLLRPAVGLPPAALWCARTVAPSLAREDGSGVCDEVGRPLFVDIARQLLADTSPQPYLVLELAKDLIGLRSPIAADVCLLLAQHCAHHGMDHPLQALLAALTAAVLPPPEPLRPQPPQPWQPASAAGQPTDTPHPQQPNTHQTPTEQEPQAASGSSNADGTDTTHPHAYIHGLIDTLVMACLVTQRDTDSTASEHTEAQSLSEGAVPGLEGSPSPAAAAAAAVAAGTDLGVQGSVGVAIAEPLRGFVALTGGQALWLAHELARGLHTAALVSGYRASDPTLHALMSVFVESSKAEGGDAGTPVQAPTAGTRGRPKSVPATSVTDLERRLYNPGHLSPAAALVRLLRPAQQAHVLAQICDRAPHIALRTLAVLLEHAGAAGGTAATAQPFSQPPPAAARRLVMGLDDAAVSVLTRQLRQGLAAVALLRELAQRPIHWSGPTPALLVALHRVHQSAVAANTHIMGLNATPSPSRSEPHSASSKHRRPGGTSSSQSQQASVGSTLVAKLPREVMVRVILSYALLSQPGVAAETDATELLSADGVLPPPLSPATAASRAVHLLQQRFLHHAAAVLDTYTLATAANRDIAAAGPVVGAEGPGGTDTAAGDAGARRRGAAAAMYDLLGEALRSRLAPHPAVAPVLRLACAWSVRLACVAAPDVDRALLARALAAAMQSDQLSAIARDLSPSEILKAASLAMQSRHWEAARLLLKHLAGQHGLRSAALAPHFAEFINTLAATQALSASPTATTTSAVTPATTTSTTAAAAAAAGLQEAATVTPDGSETSSADASNGTAAPTPPQQPVAAHKAADGSSQQQPQLQQQQGASAVQPYNRPQAAAAPLDLGGCEPYVSAMLVQLSRDEDVDLARALTGAAKRFAIRLCVAQGAPVTALKLWAAWQTRHSAMDVGTMAVCWLLVACAEVGDWAAGQQLLRFLDQELFTASFVNEQISLPTAGSGSGAAAAAFASVPAPTPSAASGLFLAVRTVGRKPSQKQLSPAATMGESSGLAMASTAAASNPVLQLQGRFISAYVRVLAALRLTLPAGSRRALLGHNRASAGEPNAAQGSLMSAAVTAEATAGKAAAAAETAAGPAAGPWLWSVPGVGTAEGGAVNGDAVLLQLMQLTGLIQQLCQYYNLNALETDTSGSAWSPVLDRRRSEPSLVVPRDPVIAAFLVLDHLLMQLQGVDARWKRENARRVEAVASELMQALNKLQARQIQQQETSDVRRVLRRVAALAQAGRGAPAAAVGKSRGARALARETAASSTTAPTTTPAATPARRGSSARSTSSRIRTMANQPANTTSVAVHEESAVLVCGAAAKGSSERASESRSNSTSSKGPAVVSGASGVTEAPTKAGRGRPRRSASRVVSGPSQSAPDKQQ